MNSLIQMIHEDEGNGLKINNEDFAFLLVPQLVGFDCTPSNPYCIEVNIQLFCLYPLSSNCVICWAATGSRYQARKRKNSWTYSATKLSTDGRWTLNELQARVNFFPPLFKSHVKNEQKYKSKNQTNETSNEQ